MKDYNQQEWRERLDSLKSPGDYFEDDYVEAQESAEENTDCGTGGANYRLRALDYWLRELEEQREIAATERTRIDMWLESQERRIQKRIDWCETTLRLYLEGTGKKSMSLPYGKLQRRAGRERIDVVLEDTFVDWAEKSGNEQLLRTTVKPDKSAILAYVKATGEEPPGVELNKGDESFTAKPDEGTFLDKPDAAA